jgi:hypothetical protein
MPQYFIVSPKAETAGQSPKNKLSPKVRKNKCILPK